MIVTKRWAMRLVLKFILVLIIVPLNLTAQKINGRWINIRQPNELVFPLVQIIEIENDSIANFDFGDHHERLALSIDNDRVTVGDSISGYFTFRGKNQLEFSSKREKGDSGNNSVKLEYVRLYPTKDESGLGNKIESNIYEFTYNGFRNKIAFNRILDEQELIYLHEHTVIGNFIELREWKGTYFIVFYFNDILTYAFPIKEIKPDYVTIYGIPGKNVDVKLNKYRSETRIPH